MGFNGITIIRLVTAALLPVLVTIGFYFAERKGRFGGLSNKWKQFIIGISFGIIAILATEFGIPYNGAVVNVRNAAPLTAGLVFGWPAGLIAGLIGGIERWFSRAGDFTRLACTIATILAGIFGASVRKFMMDNKKASWFYGLVVGVATEVLHMLLVFITNGSDIQRAFSVVDVCAVPMIVTNSLSVMLSIIAVTVMSKRGMPNLHERGENISQTFQRWLSISVISAFIVTLLFTNAFNMQIAYSEAKLMLQAGIEDVGNDIHDASDRSLLSVTYQISNVLPDKPTTEILQALAVTYGVTEINLVDKNGIITDSSRPDAVGFDMRYGEQSAEFLRLLEDEVDFVQKYQAISQDASIFRKYAGVRIDTGFLQVGYNTDAFYRQLEKQVTFAAQNRHIGQSGSIIICDENGYIVSDREGHRGKHISIFGDGSSFERQPEPGEEFQMVIYNEPSILMYGVNEGYYIIALISEEEALFSKRASVYMMAFMEMLVFVALFVNIFVLIKRLVVRNIRKINESLNLITKGNLNVTVNVRDNEEFASLSDDINSTVATLKRYIDEAAARFDKDLEIAKTIQRSALPSVFPPYPTRKEFGVFASMNAAKEVGGDFYDFYLIDENHLAFVVADVSGKGIPGAMFMMTAKTLIKNYAESGLDVNDVFTEVNTQLCEGNEAGMFVTAWMGVLNVETGSLRYANAGHNPPVIRRKNGSYEFLKGKVNFVLAGMEGVKYKEQFVHLQQGDEIYLYTDGVTEAHDANKQLFGEDRLLASLNSTSGMNVEQICKKVKADVDDFVGDAEQFDDITMLCVRRNEVENRMIAIKPTLDSIPVVSEFVEKHLEEFGVPKKLASKLLIALDEIYSNIVRYSGATEARVRIVRIDNVLRMTFRDNGMPYNPLTAKEPDVTLSAEDRAIGGLGIFMVRKMMDKVEYKYTHGKNKLTLTNLIKTGEDA